MSATQAPPRIRNKFESFKYMARYTGPKHKQCRREGIKLCDSPKCPVERKGAVPPGQHGLRRGRKPSNFAIQLREKQKVKRYYGVLERQFSKYFDWATKSESTGSALLVLLETRLDHEYPQLNSLHESLG